MPKKRKIDPEAWQRNHLNKSVTLSDTQNTMAELLDALPSRIIDRETLDYLAGPTINSFIARGYLRQHSSTTVFWTKAGSEALKKHHNAKVDRIPSGKFSSLLTLDTYDQKPPQERRPIFPAAAAK